MGNIALKPTSSAIFPIQNERECFKWFIAVGESFKLKVQSAIFPRV